MPPLAPSVSLTASEFTALCTERHAIPVDDAVFRIEGPGAITCLQGLLTNDVAKCGVGSAVWGALLTPKGMIITDAWVLRDEAAAWVAVPAIARPVLQQLLTRTIPPRLAKVSDQTDQVQLRWLTGGTPAMMSGAGWYRPAALAPFTAIGIVSAREAIPTGAQFVPHGWRAAPARYADAAKLLLGWPTLGREIDERTLVQEARFDELGGVRYDKGCYTGQEIVARLHFRGHANRLLRGVCWAPGEHPTDPAVSDGETTVGVLHTIGQMGDRTVALATIRRGVALGDTVCTGESEGVVVEPPFDLGEAAVA